MGAKPYPAYKDSGIEWIGEIPEHWNVKRLKDVAECRLSNVDKHTVDGEPSVYLCNYVDVYKNDFITSDIRFMAATATVRQISRLGIQTDDVLITKDSESPDDIGVPALVRTIVPSLVCGYHLALIRPDGQVQDGAFTFRYLASKSATSQFQVLAKGITRYAIGKGEISRLFIPSPPLEEQKLIASFLDRETGKIDTLVEKQQQLISLLKEKRQSLISHTVTKGLNPNVRMKDSGVEWIGEIPEHWEVKRLKDVVKVWMGNSFPSDDLGDDGVPVIRMSDIRNERVVLDGVKRIPAQPTFDRFKLMANDIVYGMSGSVGNIAMVDSEVLPCYLNQRVACVREINRVDHRFSWFFLVSKCFTEQILDSATGTAQINVSPTAFRSSTIPTPPLDEQKQIALFLDQETSKIDQLIDKANQSIALLKERRSSLISAAVTGKIDVREAA
jgi:type I restriction enzyme S subunit